MNQYDPSPPAPTPDMPAALEVKAGSWIAAAAWGFMWQWLKQGVSIDGEHYYLPFAQRIVIPVAEGTHAVEFYMRHPLRRASHVKQFTHSASISVARGFVQPVRYRLHRMTIGYLLNQKCTVIKQLEPRPVHGCFSDYRAEVAPFPYYSGNPVPQAQYHRRDSTPFDYGPARQNPPTEFTAPFLEPMSEYHPAGPDIAPPYKAKFCGHCGAELPATNRFCGGCGQRLA